MQAIAGAGERKRLHWANENLTEPRGYLPRCSRSGVNAEEGRPMGKVIVFCADGTWNGPGEPDDDDTAAPPTNVFKLFLNLAGVDQPGTIMLAKEQERVLRGGDGKVVQTAKYLHGVGDSNNFLVQALGGSVGAGLIARIVTRLHVHFAE